MNTQIIIAASSFRHWSGRIYQLNYSVVVDGRVIYEVSGAICESLSPLLDSVAKDIVDLFTRKNLMMVAEVIPGEDIVSGRDGEQEYVLEPVYWWDLCGPLFRRLETSIKFTTKISEG